MVKGLENTAKASLGEAPSHGKRASLRGEQKMEAFRAHKKVKFNAQEEDTETNEGKARRRNCSPIVKRMEALMVNAKLFQVEFRGKRQPKFM